MIHLPTILEPVGSVLKATASSTSIGSFFVSLINDEQTRNIEDTLQKHEDQLDILREIVIGELYVNRERYLEDLKITLQKAKDEVNEEKRRLYASYLTACCHPDNAERGNRRILLDLVEKTDFISMRILRELTTKYKGKDIDYFSQLFKEELSKNDVMVQLDFLTSYRLIEICSQEDIDRFNLRYGNRKSRHLIPRYYYKRTVLGDNLYLFISKGIV